MWCSGGSLGYAHLFQRGDVDAQSVAAGEKHSSLDIFSYQYLLLGFVWEPGPVMVTQQITELVVVQFNITGEVRVLK